MANAAGIVLTATAVSFTNEWLQAQNTSNNPFSGVNIRIPVAGGLLALFMAGVEKLNSEAAHGLATIMFITVLVTPFHGKSPVEELASLAVTKGPKHNASTQH